MTNENSSALITQYFSKEFPSNMEIEWKGYLKTCDPAGFIFDLQDRAIEGDLLPFERTKSLGSQKIGLRYTHFWHHYYAYPTGDGWHQAFVLIQPPETNLFLPHIKWEADTGFNAGRKNILIRNESKPSPKQAFPFKEIPHFIEHFESESGLRVVKMGTMSRERYSLFLTNRETNRNWSLLADRCKPISPNIPAQMAQVEIEYKGRSGIIAVNLLSQRQVLEEMDFLAKTLIDNTTDRVLQPTNNTKFDWLLQRL